MAPGWMQILVVALVALLLFGGRGKISSIMGDFAKGIKSFRTGLKDDEDEDKKPEPINVTPEKDKA
jgi:sec-independent protein translocase protein TatA